MKLSLWQQCIEKLERELPEQSINAWIRPIHAIEEESEIILLAPNQFVIDKIKEHCLEKIQTAINSITYPSPPKLTLVVGSTSIPNTISSQSKKVYEQNSLWNRKANLLNHDYIFDNFVEGKSNQIAKAAALQVASNIGAAFNPLLIYGGVGLGKTHLMHAAGNYIISNNKNKKVVYLHSERFVGDMIKSLQHNQLDQFKQYYRAVDALLIDDIQFFAGKERSQEEFFHTFNALLEEKHQIIITCDRYPTEVTGLEDRLKSRFGWGLTVAVDPPELETRVAILQKKAEHTGVELPTEIAFFIAKRLRSNVRELEGALKRVILNMQFTGNPITIESVKEVLRDLLATHEKLVTIAIIQKTVAEYYKIRISDLHSSKRDRSITRPRQIAMTLSKELTNNSLTEIGKHFGGKDHSTVLHAYRKINELKQSNSSIDEDYTNLIRLLSK